MAGVSVHQQMTRDNAWARRCSLAMLFCLSAFLACEFAAMWLYPGGNWLDPKAVGHRFFANFFCDLTQPVSLSGVKNPVGSRLAQLGMLCFAVALAGMFWVVPRHFVPGSRVGLWVRALGQCSVLSFVAVPLTPSQRFGDAHAALALVSGGFGIASALCAVSALWLAGRRVLAVLGASALTVAALDACLFLYHLRDAAPPPLIVPAAQKVAAALLVIWVAAVAGRVLFGHDARRMNAAQPKAQP